MLQVEHYSKPSQICELLQISRNELERRKDLFRSLRKFRSWKKSQEISADNAMKLYREVEGVLLRRKAIDALFMYRVVRRSRVREFQKYMDRLPNRKHVFGMIR